MTRPLPFTLFVEDLYWLRSMLRERLDAAKDGVVPRVNRVLGVVRDLCDSYQDSSADQVHIRLTVKEKELH